MPSWLQPIADANPFTKVTNATRALYNGKDPGDDVWISIAWAVGITVVFAFLSSQVLPRHQPLTRDDPPQSAGQVVSWGEREVGSSRRRTARDSQIRVDGSRSGKSTARRSWCAGGRLEQRREQLDAVDDARSRPREERVGGHRVDRGGAGQRGQLDERSAFGPRLRRGCSRTA